MTMCNDKKIEELENQVEALKDIMENLTFSVLDLQMTSCVNALINTDHCISVKIDVYEGKGETCMVCKKAVSSGDNVNRLCFINGRNAFVHDICFMEWDDHFDMPYN